MVEQDQNFSSTPPQRANISFLLLALDVIGVCGILTLVHYFITEHPPLEFILSKSFPWRFAIIIGCLYIFDVYKPVETVNGLHSSGRTILAVFTAGILISFFTYLIEPVSMYPFRHKEILLTAIPFIMVWCTILRFYSSKWIKSKYINIEWIVITDKEYAKFFLEDIKNEIPIESFILLSKDDTEPIEIDNKKVEFSGLWKDINQFIHPNCGGIVVATQRKFPDSFVENLMSVRLSGLRIFDLIDFYERYFYKLPLFHLKSGWFAFTHGFALLHNNFGWRIKKVIDYLIAATAFVAISPLFLLIALAVKLDSSGPVFFVQKRHGRHQNIFPLYKFRTMVVGSEKGNRYTQKGDKRITRIGGFLRKSRLDELPQLINILKGDMSLIGPRAEWTRCVDEYKGEIPFYNIRHIIKPGITGWAQVSYPYGASAEDAQKKLQYDLYYIKHHTLLLDLAIIIKTVRLMLFGKGT